MTLRELIALVGEQPLLLVAWFVAVPLVAWLMGRLHAHGQGGRSPWRYLYAVLVYLACVPGMLSAVLTAYALFFTRENLLDLDALVFLLPIASMAITLALIGSAVRFEQVPGFDRLSGLMLTLAVSFGIALALSRTRIWVVFGAPLVSLLTIGLAVFGLLRLGTHLMTRGRRG
jgi:hypothetical protein